MIPLNGHVWEVTLNTGEKRRVVTEGPNSIEAVSEFLRVYGDQTILVKVEYLKFRKEPEL